MAFFRNGCGYKSFSQKYFIAPQPVAKNALAANNPVLRKACYARPEGDELPT
jgi:hypothetical protein